MTGDSHLGSRPQEAVPTELVARLEAASAGSRALDLALHDRFFPLPSKGMTLPCGTVLPPSWGRGLDEPAYTTSLDAALALAERVGLRPYMADATIKGRWRWTLENSAMLGDLEAEPWASGTAKSPALALCIAVLKATAANAVGTSAASEPNTSEQST